MTSCLPMSTQELERLYSQAESFSKSSATNKGEVLYRNKEQAYFDEILEQNNGIMEPYVKDNNGDPRNPTNGELHGLFFCANVDNRTGEPPKTSPFGPTRFQVLLSHLMDKEDFNIYFADFYCMPVGTGKHYIMLVICKKGDAADGWCKKTLIPLREDNPFFVVNDDGSFNVNNMVWVEIFFTGPVNIGEALRQRYAAMSTVNSTGTSTQGGIAKDPRCLFCNVLREESL